MTNEVFSTHLWINFADSDNLHFKGVNRSINASRATKRYNNKYAYKYLNKPLLNNLKNLQLALKFSW